MNELSNRTLLENSNVDVGISDENECSALLLSTVRIDHLAIMRLLLLKPKGQIQPLRIEMALARGQCKIELHTSNLL
jgi:hypothetical protein